MRRSVFAWLAGAALDGAGEEVVARAEVFFVELVRDFERLLREQDAEQRDPFFGDGAVEGFRYRSGDAGLCVGVSSERDRVSQRVFEGVGLKKAMSASGTLP